MFLIMSRMARHIPQELVEQILIKLPPKSLIRFSTVSKGCYHFIQTLKSLQNRTPFLLAISSQKNQHSFYADNVKTFQEYARLTDLQNVKSANPVSCSNGIICFSDYMHRVFLWNPSIYKIFFLPKSHIDCLSHCHRFPFGVIVDYDKKDYKVLRTDNFGEEMTYVEIFRMSTGSWELLDYDVSKGPFRYICEYQQVDLKRVSYWVAKDMDFKVTIISFDWSEESFGSVKIPAPVKEEGKSLLVNCEAYLYLLDESLVLLYSVKHEIDDLFSNREDSDEEGDVKNYDEDVITYTFWKMEDSEGESWKLMWKIFFDKRMTPLGFRENGEFLWAGNGERHLISTNLDEGSHRYLGRCGEKRIYSCLNYVESLALRDVTSQVTRPPRSEKVVKLNK